MVNPVFYVKHAYWISLYYTYNSIPLFYKIRSFFYKHGFILFTFWPLIKIFPTGSVSLKVWNTLLLTATRISVNILKYILILCFGLGCYDDFSLRFQNRNNYTCHTTWIYEVSMTFEKNIFKAEALHCKNATLI